MTPQSENLARVTHLFAAMPKEVSWQGKTLRTSLWKEPLPPGRRVRVTREGLDGDRPGNLAVHGGEWKAVYSYAAEHYVFWRGECPGVDFDPGVFGENILTEGIDEGRVCVGDRFQMGDEVVLEAIEPRQPCAMLEARFAMRGHDGMMKRFLDSGRWGIYFRVVNEGDLAPGDLVREVSRHPARIPVASMPRFQRALRAGRGAWDNDLRPEDRAAVQRLSEDGLLAPKWRDLARAFISNA